MPTELEELVEFLHHGNTTIRQIAAENLVGFSHSQPALFKSNHFEPVNDLKVLVRDHPPIAKNALAILINLSADPAVLELLSKDEDFVKSILTRVTDPTNPNTTELSMLIANLSKHALFQSVLSIKLPPRTALGKSLLAIDHLLSVFLLGEGGTYNSSCTYEYLAYAFAELAQFPLARKYFTTPVQSDDGNIPLTKILVFTEHANLVRRRGVANTIKNVCFEIDAHSLILSTSILPFILLPLMGAEEYPDDESDKMPDELQLLPPDKQREQDYDILKTHLDTLLLLTTTRGGRDRMRDVSVYPVVRECHLATDDESVRDACDRLVQVIMRDEADDPDRPVVHVDEDQEITDIL